MTIRSIAFYLPQFHPIPENDAWWGEGFTEWRNVRRARPRFRGHYQPHVPGELGYYDLRDSDVRAAQAELARSHGVSAFCYYHYWFNGHRVLERPLDEVLATGKPDFPFMVCWANENWTRVWDGGPNQVLLEQHYDHDDDRRHIRSLLPVLADPRYLRQSGRPFLLIYRASALPDPRRTTDIWREEAQRAGLGDLLLGRVESHLGDRGDPRPLGFDVGVEFAPDIGRLPPLVQPPRLGRAMRRVLRPHSPFRMNTVHDYRALVDLALAKPDPEYPLFRCAAPGWDNSPRRDTGARIFRGADPEQFQRWFTALTTSAPADGLVFVNAWNEWAEGAHLEPDQRFGRGYLEAHREGMAAVLPGGSPTNRGAKGLS